ncbi:phage tail protein, partial [Pseudomonas aeruginosa]
LGVAVPVAIEAAAYLDGAVIDRPLSARAALEPLAQLYGLDVSAVAGTLRLRGPRREAAVIIADDDLVRVSEDEAPLRR